MKVGIPKGLLYYKYYPFFHIFFTELGAEVVTSSDTTKEILDEGVKCCVDEACLPIKIFHGHVSLLKDKCDIMVIPRIMQIRKREYICPKFCGLPEMILNSISDMPKVITAPIYATSHNKLNSWAKEAGKEITKDKWVIQKAFDTALREQLRFVTGIKNENYNINVALAGHPYNIYDSFINMNIVKKLNKLGVGVITEEYVDDESIEDEVKTLYKKPFWTFARNAYGFATHSVNKKMINGIIYISSFACGIDSVIVELIKDKIGDFPFMILKVDEHTGEAGLDTRVEAFVDMLERRVYIENNISTHG
ncbi:acyl-CoA dehydratase activase-related protein [Clostridium sp. SYSU_GA19001]|uniref:acyl-CoA dehydratase activase-related protein n=1 Tax=Clostridium caldaquaticum TaxID=2940653 RepID=UPI002076FF62|nr:acyl-CoA dehydratase activase-related protein [Clostridium caldaquaticum]MCM8709723.1 acyl-CoA dehydratase activase-related protein [Clostridium caldaquaticum]